MTSNVKFIVQEHYNILIGDNNTFSANIKFRTSNAHSIYDIDEKKWINPSGNIIIGNHVGLGEGVNISKNVKLSSGAVIYSGSLVSNNLIDSNTLNAGIHARELRNNICYDSKYVENDSAERHHTNCTIDDFVFNYVEEELLMLDDFKDNNFSLLDTYEKLLFFEKIFKEYT